jgi:hypothetical protein
MAEWVRCTRKFDGMAVYINLDTVKWLRRNDEEDFTAISWATGDENIVRVLEYPEDILPPTRVLTPNENLIPEEEMGE